MHCAVCHYYLGSHHSGNVTCPQCHHVNHFTHEHHTPAAHHSQPRRSKYRHYHKHVKAFAASFSVFFVLVFATLVNLLAQHNVSQAITLDGQGEYQKAADSLQQLPAWLVLPPINHKTKAEAQKNQKWLEYLSYQTQAEQYIKGQKYSDALVLLNKISKDYPTYSKITADITAASQHLANIPAEKVASAKAAVAKTAPQSGPENAQSAPKSTDCSTPAPIAGKRYANTDAFNALTSAGSVDQIEQQLQNFFNQYGLNVEIKNVSANSQFLSTNSVSYDSVTDSDTCSLRNLAMLLVDEWSKYPADWVRSSNLQTIVLIKNMKRVFGGSSYPVSATYDVYDSQMWYDVAYTGDYMREAIHHEYYHLLVYHYSQTSSHDDNAWLSDNPAGFAYGGGGASCYAPGNNCLSGEHPAPSFVTGYAASAMAEDQAETYAYLMTDTYYHHLKNWLQSDPLLAAKIKLQQQFIAARSSTMDTGYFDSINP